MKPEDLKSGPEIPVDHPIPERWRWALDRSNPSYPLIATLIMELGVSETTEKKLREALVAERSCAFHVAHTAEHGYRYLNGIYIHTCFFCQQIDAAFANPREEKL